MVRFRSAFRFPHRYALAAGFTAVALAVLFAFAGCFVRETLFRNTRPLMGTLVEIAVVHRDEARAYTALRDAFSEMERIEGVMSAHREDSELSRLNREGYPGPVAVSLELFEIVRKGIQWSRKTQGAFDVSVGPLLKLWPLYRAEKILPTGDAVAEALQAVGWEKVLLDSGGQTIRFRVPGMALDLGGIAKGYVIDRAVEELREAGIRSALVNAGGDLYAMGRKPDGAAWRVGVQHPRRRGELIAVLEAHEVAVVTSGDYERYFLKDGRRYSHIVDPRTGFTARGTASVTVVGPNATDADALATGVLVLGPEEGLRLVETLPGFEAAILSEAAEGGGLKFTPSSGFHRYFRVDEAFGDRVP